MDGRREMETGPSLAFYLPEFIRRSSHDLRLAQGLSPSISRSHVPASSANGAFISAATEVHKPAWMRVTPTSTPCGIRAG